MASRRTSRPATRQYMEKGIEDLRLIAKNNLGDSKIISEILDELENHRNSKGAARLARMIRNGESLDAPVRKRTAASSSSTGDEANVQPVLDGCTELLARYETLRATFSERGEILARWGITDALPGDMKEQVALIWSDRVTDKEDAVGRTLKKLASDMKYLGISMQVPSPRRTKTDAQ
jgi:hypothetical protein